jgi:hypothetical protein
MKKRNKRTEIKAHMELAPLTEHILGAMGREGDNIRKRLRMFYRQRAHKQNCRLGECLENSS